MGKLVEEKKSPWPWSRHSELWISPGAFPAECHSFVKVVDPPPDLLSPSVIVQDGAGEEQTAQDLFKHVHANVAPHLLSKASTFSANQIKEGSPLFEGKPR